MIFLITLLLIVILPCPRSISSLDNGPAGQEISGNGKVTITRIAPEGTGGQGYKMVYRVNVPIAVFWKFKTDFDNTFLLENKYIRDHRTISQDGDIVITEDKYTYGPDVYFRWQTKLFPEISRLEFILLNPEQCRQAFHYGYIQLDPEGESTRVTQVAYFDFWGATFWAYNPWSGGMREFLNYTARWEQATILRLKDQYHESNDRQ